MKAVHINTYDAVGGAARAVQRLHRGCVQVGVESSIYVLHQVSPGNGVQRFRPPTDLMSRIRRRLRRALIQWSINPYEATRPAGFEEMSWARSQHGTDVFAQLPGCDVINLHWISGFIDVEKFFRFAQSSVPVVWTLHDMNAFTGGCHYDHECGRFARSCGCCPQLGSSDENDLSNRVWNQKHATLDGLKRNRLHVVTPSRWLGEEAGRSSLLSKFPRSVIPYGLDTDDFAPRDRVFARELLGIRENTKVVLFVADQVSKKRKGIELLGAAFEQLGHIPEILLVSLGAGEVAFSERIPHRHLEFASNDRWLSLVYSAADVFVIPSLQENLGQTLVEAMACGTPAVGFDIGGNPDMIRNDETGILCPAFDTRAMAVAIERILRDDQLRTRMSARCRATSLAEHTLERVGSRYRDLYQKIINQETLS